MSRRSRAKRGGVAHRAVAFGSGQSGGDSASFAAPPGDFIDDGLDHRPHSPADEHSAHAGHRDDAEAVPDADVGDHWMGAVTAWQIGHVNDDVLTLARRINLVDNVTQRRLFGQTVGTRLD